MGLERGSSGMSTDIVARLSKAGSHPYENEGDGICVVTVTSSLEELRSVPRGIDIECRKGCS